MVDTRSSAEFGAGHIKGAINVQLASGEFEQRVGWVTPDDVPLILVTNSSADAQTAISLLLCHGYTKVYNVTGGMEAWKDAKLPTVDGEGKACAI